MNILVAGASGMIGHALCDALSKEHHVIVLGRNLDYLASCFGPSFEKISWTDLPRYDGKKIDIVINLCGANIAAKRWNDEIKRELIESRTSSNKKLIDWIEGRGLKPHYYCASAVGYYGAHDADTQPFDERTPITLESSHDFLREITLAWEASLDPLIDLGLKVTILRFGVVLKHNEGALKKMELPFSLGLGTVIGSGDQIMSWVSLEDLVRAILFLVSQGDVIGPVNITSPYPVTQKQFATLLAKTLNRPLFLKMPAFFVKLLFGEMGELLLLKGQNVIPARLHELGFEFKYPKLEKALDREYFKAKP